MEGRRVYEDVVRSGQMTVIETPRHHRLCLECPLRETGPEKLEIAMPILAGDRVVGIIGLISFTDRQTEYFNENREWVIQFLGKMAELIAGNVKEAESAPAVKHSLAELEREAIENALESVGNCVGRAGKAAKLLGISRATMYRKIQEYKIEMS